MLALCHRCGDTLRDAEDHPEPICALIAAARQVCADAHPAPEGVRLSGSVYSALLKAVETLLALNPTDIASAEFKGLLDGNVDVVVTDSDPPARLPTNPPPLVIVPGGLKR